MDVTLILLTPQFYDDYSHCPEIMQKKDRPHVQARVEVDGVLFGIPLRSHINHPHVVWTDRANRCGLDLSKAIVITNAEKYIDTKTPLIRKNEYDALRGRERIVIAGLVRYIARYKEAKANQSDPVNLMLVKRSALQYFEEYL